MLAPDRLEVDLSLREESVVSTVMTFSVEDIVDSSSVMIEIHYSWMMKDHMIHTELN